MVSRIHEKLGTAGFVIAIVALIAALAGTALAAAGLNGKQKKEVTKIAKNYAGKDGAPGAQGPKGDPGAKGDTGPEGKQGEEGKPGQDGVDGENGFCSVGVPQCVLPPGATLTGNWSFTVPKGGAEEDGETVLVTVSFPLQMPSDQWTFRWIGRDDWLEAGDFPFDRTSCPGSFTEPEAEPGFVCFYAEDSEAVFNAGGGNRREPISPITYTSDRRSGATIAFPVKDASKKAYGTGSWAATADE